MRKGKIPECSNPFDVSINGVKYRYQAGTEVEVPDDVADIIEQHNEIEHKIYVPVISGGDCNRPHVYFSDSFDKLPTDAVDGSLAMVESDSVEGAWKFDMESSLNFDSLNLHSVTTNAMITVVFTGYNNHIGFLESFVFSIESGNISLSAMSNYGEIPIYYDDMWDDDFPPFKFYGDVYGIEASSHGNGGGSVVIEPPFTIEEFKAWLSQNAERVSGGHTLYSRENGEWVSKGEVDFTNLSEV